jgi:hypothetical protein
MVNTAHGKRAALVRGTGRAALAAALLAAPLFVGAAANAEAPDTVAVVPPQQTQVQAQAIDYGDWFYWHCRVQHEWWRPRCHPEWQAPPPPPPPTGSAL